MTEVQKSSILALRMQGIPFAEISQKLDLSVNTVKSFARRNAVQTEGFSCKRCGVSIQQNEKRKRKLFCSDRCRSSWWHANKALLKTARPTICPGCGMTFFAPPYQKYCAHPCYVRARFGGGHHAEGSV